jgi:hypothetical protein
MSWWDDEQRWWYWVAFVISAIVAGVIGIWLLLFLIAPLARRSH